LHPRVKVRQSFGRHDRTFACGWPSDDRDRAILQEQLPTAKENVMEPINPTDLVRDVGARAVTAIGLAGIGLIHLLDAIGKYNETRYLFWMYVALIAASIATAGVVLFTHSRVAFLAAAGLAASAALGYVLSRTTGLPAATGDIGNWTEPLGLASLFVEGAVVAVAASAYGLLPARVRRPEPQGRRRTAAQSA
jgi:hypothetical protein